MQDTPIVTISKTEASIDALQFAHRWVMKKAAMHEEEWVTMLYESGYQFAASFSKLFPGVEKSIEDMLTKSAADPGMPNNWYWMWWKLKWMQDDWEYITYKVYDQPCPYAHFKSYMQHCDKLEAELFNLLKSPK
jgi:hypothetical protein